MRTIPLTDAVTNHVPVPFEYPQDKFTPETLKEIQTLAKAQANNDLAAFVFRLVVTLLKGADPKLKLVSLAYLSGLDLVSLIGAEDNTISAIARKVGVSKQSFQQCTKRLAQELGMNYAYANRGHKRNTAGYTIANRRAA